MQRDEFLPLRVIRQELAAGARHERGEGASLRRAANLEAGKGSRLLLQEHGQIVSCDSAAVGRFKVGDRLRVLANHSCLTAAQHSHFNVLENGKIIDRWEIHRGW